MEQKKTGTYSLPSAVPFLSRFYWSPPSSHKVVTFVTPERTPPTFHGLGRKHLILVLNVLTNKNLAVAEVEARRWDRWENIPQLLGIEPLGKPLHHRLDSTVAFL